MNRKRKSPERVAVERARYDNDHRVLRAQWSAKLKRARALPCARCGELIFASMPLDLSLADRHLPTCTRRGPKGGECIGECWSRWELGHDDRGKHYTGPEHFHCNRKAGGRKGAEVLAGRRGKAVSRPRRMVRREW